MVQAHFPLTSLGQGVTGSPVEISMWLLSTNRAELHFFPSPESVPRGYAILSHVWDKEEQTFQDTQKLCTQCATTGGNPRDLASPKIWQFCILAERHGYDWGWADTCCIDKTSSAELSEAINSMFQYYSLAEVCYAYLRDVPHDPGRGVDADVFKASVWHTRGWTLQELIAPEAVIFLSTEWEMMGTKADLATLLQETMNVPASVFLLETEVADVSIAARMSWAAKRRTTRVEDEAYCLLGIFEINMPTLYGEGQKAFRRLQEEIMKQSVDTSIFAWGGLYPAPGSERDTRDVVHCQAQEAFPLAPSPSAFRRCSDRSFVPPDPRDTPLWRARQPSVTVASMVRTLLKDRENTVRSSGPTTLRESVGIPSFTITSYGILAHVPVVEALPLTVVVLYCSDGKQHLGLPITRCPDAPDAERPLYHVSCYFPSGVYQHSVGRLVGLGGNVNDLRLNGQRVVPEWKSVYLAHHHPPVPPARALIDRGIAAPFRIPRWHIRDLQRQSRVRLLEVEHFGLEVPWSGSHSAAFIFEYAHPSIPDMFPERFHVYLGLCAASQNHRDSGDAPSIHGPHWATIRSPAPAGLEHIHSCAEDHIRDWADATKRFVLWMGMFEVVLRFTPCPLNPSGTLIVNVEFTKAPFSSAEAATQLSDYLEALALDS
ncbi:HET-domain-containing protein [Ganoderma leucocontextum]|nr:HET-domain-containing protein [Ganoderma leucocontextum]